MLPPMHINTKKQNEQNKQNNQKLNSLLKLEENKKCFDCSNKFPYYVNTHIYTFVCSRCSGLVREVGHRVKSISTSEFTSIEVAALEYGGNELARSIWLSNYKGTNCNEPEKDGEVRCFMRQKYYEKKWLDYEKYNTFLASLKSKLEPLIMGNNELNRMTTTKTKTTATTTNRPDFMTTKSSDDNIPLGLICTLKDNTISSIPKPITTTNSDFFAELAELSPNSAITTTTTNNNNMNYYSGGILQPNSPATTTITNSYNKFITSPISPITSPATSFSSKHVDPYAALRDLSIGSVPNESVITTSLNNKDSDEVFGDFQKSPTTATTNNTNHTKSNPFSDLDSLFNR